MSSTGGILPPVDVEQKIPESLCKKSHVGKAEIRHQNTLHFCGKSQGAGFVVTSYIQKRLRHLLFPFLLCNMTMAKWFGLYFCCKTIKKL
jgi:hypothetical protein